MSVPIAAIRDVTLPVGNWNPTKSPDEEFRYIDLGAVDQILKTISKPSDLLGADAPSRARQVVACGDVLVSTVRPNLNGVAAVTSDLDGAIASTGFCVLRPKPDRLDGRYLAHWVQSPKFIDLMVREATGASYPAVSDKIVKASALPLPPLPEQRRIATILDMAASLRRKRKRSIELLDSLTQVIFLEMFGDPVINPYGLAKKPLSELIRVKSGEGLVAKSMAENGRFPVYGGNGISGYHDQYMFEDPQIVMGRVGAYCGAVHITQPHSWVTDNALYVSEMKHPLSVEYLAAALKQANFNQYAGRAAQPLISGSRIYPVEIFVPSTEQQGAFEAAINTFHTIRRQLMEASGKIEALFQSLQSQAFTGSLL